MREIFFPAVQIDNAGRKHFAESPLGAETAYSKNAVSKQQLDTQQATVHQLEGTAKNDQRQS